MYRDINLHRIMKKLLLALVVTISTLSMTSCEDEPYYNYIDPSDLPGPALSFIRTYYPTDPIWDVYIGGYYNDSYVVEMESGAIVYFDTYGNWYAVYAPTGYGVPYGIVPLSIENFVSYYYPYATINGVETNDYGGYHIILTNGREIDFDRWGNPL